MWINPFADNSDQSKICPNCGQENDRYGLPIYPFNKSTKVLNWCTKCSLQHAHKASTMIHMPMT